MMNGEDKYIKWINNIKNTSINFGDMYSNMDILLIKFNKMQYTYAIIYYNENTYVSFGITYVSCCKRVVEEYNSHFIKYSELSELYENKSNEFSKLERLILNLYDNNVIDLLSVNTLNGTVTFNHNNIFILAIIINTHIQNIINKKYESNVCPTFVKMIKFFYNYNSSILDKPCITFGQHLGSKLILDSNIDEITLADPNIVREYNYIFPVTTIFFNNKFTSKHHNTAILLVMNHIGNNLTVPCKSIQNKNIFELLFNIFKLHYKNILYNNIAPENIIVKENTVGPREVDVFILSEIGQYDTFVFNTTKKSLHIVDYSNVIKFTDKTTDIYLDYINLITCLSNIFDNSILKKIELFCKKMIKENNINEIILFREIFKKYLFNNTHIDLNINNIYNYC